MVSAYSRCRDQGSTALDGSRSAIRCQPSGQGASSGPVRQTAAEGSLQCPVLEDSIALDSSDFRRSVVSENVKYLVAMDAGRAMHYVFRPTQSRIYVLTSRLDGTSVDTTAEVFEFHGFPSWGMGGDSCMRSSSLHRVDDCYCNSFCGSFNVTSQPPYCGSFFSEALPSSVYFYGEAEKVGFSMCIVQILAHWWLSVSISPWYLSAE